MKKALLCSIAVLSFSGLGMAQTEEFSANVDFSKFEDQDNMFWDRENLTEADVDATLAGYDKLLKSGLSGDDLFYAVYQANKLAAYYGDHVLSLTDKKDISKRIALFSDCEKRAENYLDPKKMNAPFNTAPYVAQFYAWKLQCMALRAEVSNDIVKGFIAAELKLIKDVSLKLDVNMAADGSISVTTSNKTFGDLPPCFDGGSIMRTMAGIMSNKKAETFGLYNLEKAVLWSEAALRVKKDAASFCFSDGTNFFNNFIYKSDALAALGRTSEAKDVLTQALKRYLPTVAAPLDRAALISNLEAFSSGAGDGLEEMLPEQKVELMDLANAYEAL